jgi:hypothetical protein
VQLAQIDKDIAEVVGELAGVDTLPDDQAELRAIVEDGNSSDEKTTDAVAKLSMLQKLTELEAQREVTEEGRPRRKQQAATVETTAKQAANTPFRTGDIFAKSERDYQTMSREEQRMVNEVASRIRGKKLLLSLRQAHVSKVACWTRTLVCLTTSSSLAVYRQPV